MRFTIAKNGNGGFNLYAKRTRREEKRVRAEMDVPVDQVPDAIEQMVSKARVSDPGPAPGS